MEKSEQKSPFRVVKEYSLQLYDEQKKSWSVSISCPYFEQQKDTCVFGKNKRENQLVTYDRAKKKFVLGPRNVQDFEHAEGAFVFLQKGIWWVQVFESSNPRAFKTPDYYSSDGGLLFIPKVNAELSSLSWYDFEKRKIYDITEKCSDYEVLESGDVLFSYQGKTFVWRFDLKKSILLGKKIAVRNNESVYYYFNGKHFIVCGFYPDKGLIQWKHVFDLCRKQKAYYDGRSGSVMVFCDQKDLNVITVYFPEVRDEKALWLIDENNLKTYCYPLEGDCYQSFFIGKVEWYEGNLYIVAVVDEGKDLFALFHIDGEGNSKMLCRYESVPTNYEDIIADAQKYGYQKRCPEVLREMKVSTTSETQQPHKKWWQFWK